MSSSETSSDSSSRLRVVVEVVLLVALFFVYAGEMPPMVNEAHYLVKAKNYWQPEWCANDLFVASDKAHTTFYFTFGWLTQVVSFEAAAWIGRLVGWTMLAFGLQRLCWQLLPRPWVSLGVASIWIAGIEYGNLAGEWVVGGIEAKVPAYGFVLLAMAQMVQRRWTRVWPLLGAASAFHVLSGGWSVIAATLTWWMTERRREDRMPLVTPSLFIGGAIALLGLVPALRLTLDASSADSTAAARIYTYFRIKHHLLPADFAASWYLRHGLLIAATAIMVAVDRNRDDDGRWRRLVWFTSGAVLIAVAGLIVGALPSLAPDLAAKLLRYYWFRLTDAIVPLLFALFVIRNIAETEGARRMLAIGLLVLSAVLITKGSFEATQLGVPPSVSNQLLGWDMDASPQQQQKVASDWRSVCRWVRAATDEDEVLLTPRHQQTFKWYAERSEVVNWKDVPQDAESLLEWQRRFRDVFPRRLGTVRVTIQYAKLRDYRKQYGVRYMIVDRRVSGMNLPLIKVYPQGVEQNDTYAVYELPSG